MKKNGFSNIEILVVIVVLAALILIAMPLVSMIMSSSEKSSLKSAVVEAVKFVDQSFLEHKKREEGKKIEGNIADDEGIVYEVTVNDVKYNYYCIGLSRLKNETPSLKDINDDYRGYFEIFEEVESKKSATYVNISNGKYYIQDKFEDISKDNYKVSDKDKKDNNFNCPKAISLP